MNLRKKPWMASNSSASQSSEKKYQYDIKYRGVMQWPQRNLISGAAKNIAKVNSNKLKQIARPYIMSASSNPVALKSNAIKNL